MGAYGDFGLYLVRRGLVSDGAWARVQEVLSEAQQGLAGTITGPFVQKEKRVLFLVRSY